MAEFLPAVLSFYVRSQPAASHSETRAEVVCILQREGSKQARLELLTGLPVSQSLGPKGRVIVYWAIGLQKRDVYSEY